MQMFHPQIMNCTRAGLMTTDCTTAASLHARDPMENKFFIAWTATHIGQDACAAFSGKREEYGVVRMVEKMA